MTRTRDRSADPQERQVDRPQDLVEAALEAARSRSLPAAVLVEETWTVNLRWALSGLTTNGATRSRSITAIVAHQASGGTAAGVLTRPATDGAAARQLVADAATVAADGAPAEDAQELVGGGVERGWDDPAGETGPGRLAELITGLGEVFGRSRATGREAFGYAVHRVETTWLGTSNGLRYRVEQPTGTCELNAKSHARSRSAWVGARTRDFSDLGGSAVLAMDDELARRLEWQGRRIDVPPGRHDTVLPPSAVADLMIYAYWSAGARSAAEGRSVFSATAGSAASAGPTRLGERLSDVPLTLSCDPDDADLACSRRVLTTSSSPMASVFDNGLPIGATRWLDAGVLGALAGTRHTEELTGVPLASAAGNLSMSAPGGAGSALDLVAGLDDGLLLTCLWYIREVDPQTLLLTGLTRDGVYVVRGGEVVGSAGNFRFNESPVDLLGRVQGVGAGEVTLPREWSDWFTRARMPALRVSSMNMSTGSEAS